MERQPVRFEPLRPASGWRVVAALVLGPILWLASLVVVAWQFASGRTIQLALLVLVASFLLWLVVLVLLREARRRQEGRYGNRG